MTPQASVPSSGFIWTDQRCSRLQMYSPRTCLDGKKMVAGAAQASAPLWQSREQVRASAGLEVRAATRHDSVTRE